MGDVSSIGNSREDRLTEEQKRKIAQDRQLSQAIVTGDVLETENLIGAGVTPNSGHIYRLLQRGTYQESGEEQTRSVIRTDDRTNPEKPVLRVFKQRISYQETSTGYDQTITTLTDDGAVWSAEKGGHRPGIRSEEHRQIATALVAATPDQELFSGVATALQWFYDPHRVFGTNPHFSPKIRELHDDLFAKAETKLRQSGEYENVFGAVEAAAAMVEPKTKLGQVKKWHRAIALHNTLRQKAVQRPPAPAAGSSASVEELNH